MRTLLHRLGVCLLLGSCSDGTTAISDAAPEPPDSPPIFDAAPPSYCATAGLPARPFAEGETGTLRHDLAADFTVELHDGTAWTLRERWSGCESYIFLPDSVTVSTADPRTVWDQDVDTLVLVSPKNVHYFFVTDRAGDAADAAIAAAVTRVEEALDVRSGDDVEHWRERLHVVGQPAAALGNWVGDELASGHGQWGLAIDRFQEVRDVGSLADVSRYDASLDWPWENNLAYLANEARYYNFEAERQARLDAQDAVRVHLWQGDVLAEFAEIEVELPTAAELAGFDTLEIDVTMRCPDAQAYEAGNCGAWDYIANLFVYDASDQLVELGRFITTYHREGRFVVDATPMLVHLEGGGLRRFRWSFAPSWNTQPTATWLTLRFSNQGKGYRPAEATLVATGGGFGAAYNDGRVPVDVPIPADAARVELWAILTGHGMGTNNCAEFCNHQHELTVNGVVHLFEFPGAQTQAGCMATIGSGTVPNQYGTWWYGRGGWCPGRHVDPQVADVTTEVTPGTTATVTYEGLYEGGTPPDGSGDIVLGAYLVVYR